MKYKFETIKVTRVLILTVSLFTSGCLKDKAFENGDIQSVHTFGSVPKIIELKTNAANTTNNYTVAFPSTGNDTTINFIPVNLATAAVADKDIHVTLQQNDQLVADYNTANGSSYLTPGSLVTILNPGGLVVIPKGSHTGYLQIKFKTSALAGGQYALAFSIKSIAESDYIISGNAQNALGILLAKNKYDGVYQTKGTFVHPVYGASWTFNDNVNLQLNTSGATSVISPDFNTLLADFSFHLELNVNADNTVNVVLNGNPSAPNPENRYDPATRTFYVKGGYGTRRLVDTLTFLHP